MSILLSRSLADPVPGKLTERSKFLAQVAPYVHPRIFWGGASYEADSNNIYRNGTMNYTARNQGDEMATLNRNSFGVGQPPDPATWGNLCNMIGDKIFLGMDMEGSGNEGGPGGIDQWTVNPDLCDLSVGSDYYFHWQLIEAARLCDPFLIITEYHVYPTSKGSWFGVLPQHPNPSIFRIWMTQQRSCVAHFAGLIDAFMPAIYPIYKGRLLADLGVGGIGNEKWRAREYWMARNRILVRNARIAAPGKLVMPIMHWWAINDQSRLEPGYDQEYLDQALYLFDGMYQFAFNGIENDDPDENDSWVQIVAAGLETMNAWTAGTKPARRLRHEIACPGVPETFQFHLTGNGSFAPDHIYTAYQSCWDHHLYGVGADCRQHEGTWLAPDWLAWNLEPHNLPEHKTQDTNTSIQFDFTDHETSGFSVSVKTNGIEIATYSSALPFSGAGTLSTASQSLTDPLNPGLTAGDTLVIL